MHDFIQRRAPGHYLSTEPLSDHPPERDGQSDRDFRLGDYWTVIRRRRWTVVAASVIVVTLTALVSFRMTPVYEASGRIAIMRETPVSLGKETRAEVSDDDYAVEMDTQVRILQSDTLALEVARRTNLQRNPTIVGSSAGADGNEIDPRLQPAVLSFIHRNLRVSPVGKSRVLEIRFTSTDPRLAADVVNATAAAYIEQNFKARYDATVQTSEWLSKELADLQARAEAAQEKLVQYQKENGIVEIGEKQNVITSKLDDLNKELTAAEADRIHKEAAYRMAADDAANVHSDGTTLADKLRERQADLRTQYALMNTQFGPNYPKVLELKNQLEEVERGLQAEEKRNAAKARNEYLAAVEREKLLRRAFDQQKNQANELNERSVQFALLKRDVDTSRSLYENLLEKLKEAGVMASLKSSNVHVVDSARVPTRPAKPNIPQNLEIALFSGLIAGIALAFIMESLDHTVRDPEQVQLAFGAPSLGVIPLNSRRGARFRLTARDDGGRDVALITCARPASEVAECYRALRTSLLLSGDRRAPQVMLISSCLPQEGKTTTAINTATVLAQKNARVLLMDADLRRPSVHRHLGLTSSHGLSSVLKCESALKDAIVASDVENLFVLPAGPVAPNPAESLASAAMREVIDWCRAEFDYVVIDTPPLLSVTDAVLLSVEVDACVLVVRAGKTPKAALGRARDLLRHVNANVVGVVLNAVDLRADDKYYYGSYRYYAEATPERAADDAVSAD